VSNQEHTNKNTMTNSQESINEDADKSGRLSARKRRQKNRDGLRSKSTGVGVSIAPDGKSAAPVNKKIVFDDDYDDGQQKLQAEEEIDTRHDSVRDERDKHSDDDDAVEEMKTSDARVQAEEQQTREKATAHEALVLKGSKRKRKKKPANKSGDDDKEELDDEFFEKLDAELEQERKNRKEEKEIKDSSLAQKRRRTAFVVSDETLVESIPTRTDENVEVVVLKDEAHSAALVNKTFKVSKAALLFSRSQIADGSDVVSAKQLQKGKKSGRTVDYYSTGWKRSKKMNNRLLPGLRNKRRNTGAVATSS